MNCELIKSDDMDDWYTIERTEHPNKHWLEKVPDMDNCMGMQYSGRVADACVEGYGCQMVSIAEAIEKGESASHKRCAAIRVDDTYELFSPRNSMGNPGVLTMEEARELAADIREKLKGVEPADEPEPEEPSEKWEEPKMTGTEEFESVTMGVPVPPELTEFGYHATVNFKVHLSHQVCQVEGGESYKSIDFKMVARAVEVALEALQGPAAGELPHLRLYLHGCMVTADIEGCQWLEQVPEPVRVKRCESEGCTNDILRGADKYTPYCSASCQDEGENQ